MVDFHSVARARGGDVPLGQDEQRLVPKDGHVPWVSLKANEVEDERIDDFVRQGILLIQQHANEQAVGP